MDLSIIFVNWNSAAYLRESIASVYEHTDGIVFEIVVVDNASPEGGVDILGEQFPTIRIVKCEQNVGFAGANNIGFRNSTGEYVLFLNPDTKLAGPAINIMMKHIKTLPDAGIVGCKLLNTDLTVQIEAVQKFPTILNQVLAAEYLQVRFPRCPLWDIAPLFSNPGEPVKVEVIPGACMLLRRGVLEQVGMFSEEYFMYAEDIDLNYKTRQAGFVSYYIGEAAVIHHGGKSSSRQHVSQWSTIMKYRAMVLLFRKTRGGLYASLYRAAMCAAALIRLLLLALTGVLWNKKSLECALRKWASILMWAIGLTKAEI